MNYEKEIKKLEAQIEEAEAQIKVLKAVVEANQEAPPIWKPDAYEAYYLPKFYGIEQYRWSDDNDVDKYYLAVGEVFKTKQEAENYDRALKLIETIRRERFKAQGNWWPSEGEVRYTVCWDQFTVGIDTDYAIGAVSSDVFGLWQEFEALQSVITKHYSELKWYFTEYMPTVN